MKRSTIIIMTLLGGWLCSAEAHETVTITQCYEWARENFPQIRRFDLIDRTEQYNLSNAGKGWLPQLAVSAKASYQSDVTKLSFAEQLSDLVPGIDIPIQKKDQYQMAVEVDQTLWDGGMIRSAKEATRAEADYNRKQLESDLYLLNERVNQIYFGCLVHDEMLAQNSLLQQDLQLNLDRVVAMMENGVSNLSDRESLEVELLNAKQKEIELKASRKAYGQMLSVLTGKQLTDALLQIPLVAGEELPVTIRRPELQAFEAQSLWIETQNRQLTAGLMPRIGAFVQGGYGRPGLNLLDNTFNPYYVAGVRLSWNLGKLYTLKNDRRKVEVNRRMVDVQRETFLFNTRLQMLQQHAEVRKLAELMVTDERIVRLRESIKRSAEVKFANGVISVTDLIREIHAEDMARQTASLHKIQQLFSIYNYMYTVNNE